MSYSPADILKQYWLGELGCSESDLHSGKTIVRPHGTLRGYQGIMVLKKDETCLISAPERLVENVDNFFCRMPAKAACDPLVFQSFLGNQIDRVVGPAWLGQVTSESYIPHHDETVRELSTWDSFEEFLLACPQD